MGLKGNLATIHLADVLKILSQGNSSGLLRIQAPEGPRFVEILDGAISIAGRSTERLLLGDLLLSRGLLDYSTLEAMLAIQKESNQLLGQLLLDRGIVSQEQLEDALCFQIEEEVCELFTLISGDFDFLANATLDAKIAPGGGMIRLKIDPNELLIEATRRAEEWKLIEQRIPHQALLFQATPAGQNTLTSGEGISAEGAVLMRLIITKRTIESIVRKTCLGRLTINQMLIELWDAGYIELLPLLDYEKVAREHLQHKRYEEAMRIALLLSVTAEEEHSSTNAATAQTLINDIERTRKLATQASSVKVMTDPKVRSEVIRRSQPGVFLKKERSSTPYAIIGIIVLILIGLGGYIAFKSNAPQDKSDEAAQHRQLDEAISKSNDLINAENYEEGLKVLQDFKSPLPDIQKLGNDAYNKQVKLLETIILRASDAFDAALTDAKSTALKIAGDKLGKLLKIGVNNPEVHALRADIVVKYDRYRTSQRIAQFKTRLTEIRNASKTQTVEQTEAALQTFLTDTPPEEIAADAREEAAKLFRLRIEMTRLLLNTDRIRKEGHIDSARLEYGHILELLPNSQPAVDAEKGLNAIAVLKTQTTAQLDGIENKISQKKNDEARIELQKLLVTPLPNQIRSRSLLLFQSITPEDPALKKSIDSASQNWERQNLDIRACLLKAIDQAPFSRSATQALLKARIVTFPEGADVLVDGQPFGKSPLAVPLPASGPFVLSIKKEGFRPTTLYLNNVRQEILTIKLERIPFGQRRMPLPARSGLVADAGASGDRLLLLSNGELCVVARPSLKILERVKLPGSELQQENGLLSFHSKGENIVISGADPTLLKATVAHSDVVATTVKWTISGVPRSAPLIFDSAILFDQTLVAVSTPTGMDLLDLAKGTLYKHLTLTEPHESFSTVTLVNERLLLTKKECLISLTHSGEQKWSTPLPGLQSTIAVFRQNIAVVTVSADATAVAKLSFVSLNNGIVGTSRNLKEIPRFGAQAADQAIVLTYKGGLLEYHTVDKETPSWTWSIQPSEGSYPIQHPDGEITLQPVLNAPNKTMIVCTLENGIHYLNTLRMENGQLLYRATLNSKPHAVTFDAKKIYVSTDDGDMTVFE